MSATKEKSKTWTWVLFISGGIASFFAFLGSVAESTGYTIPEAFESLVKEKKCQIPDVIGLSELVAVEELKESHFKYAVEYVIESDSSAGKVLNQHPQKGTYDRCGRKVILQIGITKSKELPLASTKEDSEVNYLRYIFFILIGLTFLYLISHITDFF